MGSSAHRNLIEKVAAVFAQVARPDHFTDYTHCCECAEHDDTLRAHAPDSIPREALGHARWDPMTFATDTGFRYYLPAMIRLALTGSGDDYYIDQFLSQIVRDGPRNSRWCACTPEERSVVAETLYALVETRAAEIENNLDADRLMQAIDIWADSAGDESAL